jgi:putative sterol carrier protein
MSTAIDQPLEPARFSRQAWKQRGAMLFRSYVRRSDDERLERTVGSPRGMAFVFGALAGAFRPEGAEGWTGDIQYDLRRADGGLRQWTVSVGVTAAAARRGPSADPRLVIKMRLVDFLRMAGGELDPGRALLTGRLDLAGDISVAMRLSDMFGQPGA